MVSGGPLNQDAGVKQRVSDFYDEIGWHEDEDGLYQNASYEDLRPVSQDYIRKCHLRVLRHLKPQGKYLLDAGSGPIQYPVYLEYSRGYQYRVCADISIVALQEARKRIGDHGLFVVCDVANLPFQDGAFDGVVSLHTIHHLPFEEHRGAYLELYRMLAQGAKAVVVNGWGSASPITKVLDKAGKVVKRVQRGKHGIQGIQSKQGIQGILGTQGIEGEQRVEVEKAQVEEAPVKATGTFVRKEDPRWLVEEVGSRVPLEIWVWRSVNVGFLRAFIHENRGGRAILKMIYWLEEHFPHFFGKYGNYPLVVMRKDGGNSLP